MTNIKKLAIALLLFSSLSPIAQAVTSLQVASTEADMRAQPGSGDTGGSRNGHCIDIDGKQTCY